MVPQKTDGLRSQTQEIKGADLETPLRLGWESLLYAVSAEVVDQLVGKLHRLFKTRQINAGA